jgi:hypothetical protein
MDKFAFGGYNPGWLKIPCTVTHYDADTAQISAGLASIPFQAQPSATIREWLDCRIAACTKGHSRLSRVSVISSRAGTEAVFYNVNTGYMDGKADLTFMLDLRMDEVFTAAAALTIHEKAFDEPRGQLK